MSLYGFSWVIEGKLAAMAMPDRSREDLEELAARGVGALVNLTNRDWPAEVLKEGGLAYLQLPVPDFRPPQPRQVDQFMKFCDENIAEGRAVVVHCVAGRGRTGTMVACYLVYGGMEPRKAVAFIRSLRGGSIETLSQEAAVHDFAARRSGPA